MKRRERLVRLLPAPAKTAVKRAYNAVGSFLDRLYKYRTGDDTRLSPAAIRARTGHPTVNLYAIEVPTKQGIWARLSKPSVARSDLLRGFWISAPDQGESCIT